MNYFSEYRYLLLLSPFILLSLGTFFIYLLKDDKYRDLYISIISFFLFICLCNLYISHFDHGAIFIEILKFSPTLSISFSTEPLSLIFSLMVSLLWFLTHIYSIYYMRILYNKYELDKFYTLTICSVFITIAIIFSANLLTLYFFYELLTFITYKLVIFDKKPKSEKSGIYYLMLLIGTSLLFFLPAIILTYISTGSLDFKIGGIFNSSVQFSSIIFILYVLGIGKYALFPFHSWLPAAMVAPTPVSALLHSVLIVKVGLFSLFKIIIYIYGLELIININKETRIFFIIEVLSITSILIGSFCAYRENSLKKLLAYSTISQLAYSMAAISIGSKTAIIISIFQMISHAFSKITLFFSVGNIYLMTNYTKISSIKGIANYNYKIFFAFTIASLSIIGIPITSGFISKLYIISEAWEEKHYFLIIVFSLSSILSMSYFTKIISHAYFRKQNSQMKINKLNFLLESIPIFTALSTIIIAIYADKIIYILTETLL